MADLADDDLVALYRDGDACAFEALFDRHHVAVYNFARVMLGDEGEAQEVAQDTFLAVARTACSYEARGTFRPWLMQIARNQCLNRIASRQARRRMIAPNGLTMVDPADESPDPYQRTESNERMARLRSAIESLPARQREALVLYAYEQMSYGQIAEVLATPMNTVKTLIFRARAELAKNLETQ